MRRVFSIDVLEYPACGGGIDVHAVLREVLRARWTLARSDRLRALRTRIQVLG